MSRTLLLYAAMAAALLQSWQLALTIPNLCLISAVMALGVNVQWGLAGMFNVGTMGSAAVSACRWRCPGVSAGSWPPPWPGPSGG